MTMHEINRRAKQRARIHRLEAMAIANLFLVVTAMVGAGLYFREKPVEAVEQPPVEITTTAEPVVKAEVVVAVEEAKAPRYDATLEELAIVARVVHAEAIGEGFDGMALVAQCILNTAEATGKRPDEVVLEPKQYATPVVKADAEALEAVEAVFIDGYEVTDEPIRWFYSPANLAYSKWHEENLEYILTHKGHKFFMEKVK